MDEIRFKIVDTGDKDYPHNVQILETVNGRDYFYCGHGKFCKDDQEVRKFIKETALKAHGYGKTKHRVFSRSANSVYRSAGKAYR